MITDSIGKQIGEVVSFPTEIIPTDFVKSLISRIEQIVKDNESGANCDGIGVVVS